MSVHKLYFTVRDKLVSWGVVEAPRFYMRRRPAGSVRTRLARRGSRRRVRRLALPGLLNSGM